MGTAQWVGRVEGILLRVYYRAVKAEMESAQPPVSDQNKRGKERHPRRSSCHRVPENSRPSRSCTQRTQRSAPAQVQCVCLFLERLAIGVAAINEWRHVELDPASGSATTFTETLRLPDSRPVSAHHHCARDSDSSCWPARDVIH
jgi:hypothetical protein